MEKPEKVNELLPVNFSIHNITDAQVGGNIREKLRKAVSPMYIKLTVQEETNYIVSPIDIGSDDTTDGHRAEAHGRIALWDTGASQSSISSAVAKQMNLAPLREVLTGSAAGETRCDVFRVNLRIGPKSVLHDVEVHSFESDKYDFLIGMDIISLGRLEVDFTTQFGPLISFTFLMSRNITC